MTNTRPVKCCSIITNDQTILTKGRIAGMRILEEEKLMWHRPVESNAVGSSSRADAVIDFLLHTPQR